MNRMQKLQVILAVVRVKKFVYRNGQRAWFAKEKISMLLKEAFEKGLSRGEQAEALPLGSWGVSHEPQLCLGKALMGSRTICPAQPMPCAGTDTYIKSWKGEEETASTFQKALNKEGRRAPVEKGPCGWQSDQREVLLMHTADFHPCQPGKSVTLISALLLQPS